MPYPCYWLEPTDVARRYLRRYSSGSPCPLMPGTGSYHDARVRIEDAPLVRDADGYVQSPASVTLGKLLSASVPAELAPYATDARWPTHCACSYEFRNLEDQWQLFVEPVYRRTDTGDETTLGDAEPGAMWDAFWMTGPWDRGPDGLCLVVKTPGGEWVVDGRASNCTMPEDKWDTPGHHYCWVRHGDPRQPATLSVDKNGPTCNAGAGSIQCGNYHGFLTGGVLT